MKALVLHESGKPFELEDVRAPAAGPGEVLIRVRACGLGLTLVWNRADRQRNPLLPVKLPRIMGHEIAGEVAAVGPGVTQYREGDRVAVYYYLFCGNCLWCVGGREDLCDRLQGNVGQHIDGGLAEYVVVPARNVCAIPDGVTDVDAAVATDAIATPLHVLRRRARLRPSETVAVVGGGGGVGIHMVEMARALGGRPIGIDIDEQKLELMRQAGADDVIDAREGDVAAKVRRLTGGRGADVVVEMVGTLDTLPWSYASVGKGGRLVYVGAADLTAELSVNPRRLTGEEITLTGSRYCTMQDLADTLRLIAIGRVRAFVTRTCSLEDVNSVFDALEQGQIPGRAAAVIP